MNSATYISGATGFAGLKLAEHLAGQGRNLLLSARDEDRLKEISETLSLQYPNQEFRFFSCDLAAPETWEGVASKLKDFRVSQYLNCSGIQGSPGPSLELSHEEITRVFNVNLWSSIFFTNYFCKNLKNGEKLAIIHFSGGGATNPRPKFMSYSLSKTALVRFVENFAAENENTNIRINAVAPGIMPSRMQDEIIQNLDLQDSKEHLKAVESISTGNFDSTKLLSLCDFLLSGMSEGITGKLISAEWDNWAEWPNHLSQIRNSDLYTLRRITGRDRDQSWGDV
jgi:3-oxoacyl-[acyl-carrier protein] reductase